MPRKSSAGGRASAPDALVCSGVTERLGSGAHARNRALNVLRKNRQLACKPGSVWLRLRGSGTWQPFIWDCACAQPRATHPDDRPGNRLDACAPVSSLFGFAPGGVYRAVHVAMSAVGSYPTLSPLLREAERFAFCGTFPGVAPAGRYPAPCFRGARTFLTPRPFGACEARLPGQLAEAH
ncbi:hypothetical protein ABIA23_002073 [Sinorhizobium fredii]